ncbi:MAG: ribosome assembly cofactor RimP [Bacteroidetes bacterium]|nr:ribosome assembly cofactor RimP [Bacteroidota bacterium]
MTKEHILNLADAHLAGSSVYITNIKIGGDNHININIDGDKGVNIDDCVALSRAIEGALDRDEEDYSLDVSSHGATTPLVLPRQYKRHIGRTLEVKFPDGNNAEGELIKLNDNGFTLQYSVRENKPIGKGKVTVVKEQTILFAEIKEARIKLKY